MEVVERIGEHYDVREVEGGLARSYKWYPECIVVECKCGKRSIREKATLLGPSVTTCECGEDDMARIREEMVTELLDEDYEASYHLWRCWHTLACGGIL